VTLLGQGTGLGDPQRSLPTPPCWDSGIPWAPARSDRTDADGWDASAFEVLPFGRCFGAWWEVVPMILATA